MLKSNQNKNDDWYFSLLSVLSSLCVAPNYSELSPGTLSKRPLLVSDHLQKATNRFVCQSNTVSKTLSKAITTIYFNFLSDRDHFLGWKCDIFVCYLFPRKRPPGMITYDCKKTIARMSQKFSMWQRDQVCWQILAADSQQLQLSAIICCRGYSYL